MNAARRRILRAAAASGLSALAAPARARREVVNDVSQLNPSKSRVDLRNRFLNLLQDAYL